MHREWTTNNTPHRQKYYTSNLHGEHINVLELNGILTEELRNSILQHDDLVELLFPDSLLGFPVKEATGVLENLEAFSRVGIKAPEGSKPLIFKKKDISQLIFHDGIKRQVSSESCMADHLNHIIAVLEELYPTLSSKRKWSSGNCTKPIPGTQPRKPDIVLCDSTALKNQLAPSWSLVHSIVEINSVKCGKKIRVPSPIQNTIHNKALLIFEAQPTRRFFIASWFTQTSFGLIYFDHAGEIRGTSTPMIISYVSSLL